MKYEMILRTLSLLILLAVVVYLVLLFVQLMMDEPAQEKQIAEGSCFDANDITENILPTRSVKTGFIFVSVASYRDDECRDTVADLFEFAKFPERIVVGVCQQNKEQEEDCFDRCPECKKRKERKQIKVINFDSSDAKGPCFARFHCSRLWEGEEFYFQIDSHTTFIKHWDEMLIDQWRKARDPKAVLSTYPPENKELADIVKKNFTQFSKLCNGFMSDDGIPQFTAQILSTNKERVPVPSGISSAGMLFFPGIALHDCPFDPFLNFLFFGEELLFSARLFTNGYNFYTPAVSVVGHHYERKGKPKFWDNKTHYRVCRDKAIKRVKHILGLIPLEQVDKEYRQQIDRYGLGSVRTIEDYWKYNGVDFKEKKWKISKCRDNDYGRLA